METKAIAKINNIEIAVSNDELQLVPIRPICEALGISYSSQLLKIKDDNFLSPTMLLSKTVAADGKIREMACLPLKFIYGWLAGINPKNVAPEAEEAVSRYRLICYNTLYEHFNGSQKKLIEQNEIEIKLLESIAEYSQEINAIKQNLNEQKRKLQQLRDERLRNELTLF